MSSRRGLTDDYGLARTAVRRRVIRCRQGPPRNTFWCPGIQVAAHIVDVNIVPVAARRCVVDCLRRPALEGSVTVQIAVSPDDALLRDAVQVAVLRERDLPQF